MKLVRNVLLSIFCLCCSSCFGDLIFSNVTGPLIPGGPDIVGSGVDGMAFDRSQLFESPGNYALTDAMIGLSNLSEFGYNSNVDVWLYSDVYKVIRILSDGEEIYGHVPDAAITEIAVVTAPGDPALVTANEAIPIELSANTFYWIVAKPDAANTEVTWDEVSGSFVQSLEVDGNLESATPEPTGFATIGLFLFGFAMLRKRFA